MVTWCHSRKSVVHTVTIHSFTPNQSTNSFVVKSIEHMFCETRVNRWCHADMVSFKKECGWYGVESTGWSEYNPHQLVCVNSINIFFVRPE